MINPTFLGLFTAYFDPDILDYKDKNSILIAVDRLVLAIRVEHLDMRKLKADLSTILGQWQGSDIQLFSNATNLDWQSSIEAEEDLRHILKSIITEL